MLLNPSERHNIILRRVSELGFEPIIPRTTSHKGGRRLCTASAYHKSLVEHIFDLKKVWPLMYT